MEHVPQKLVLQVLVLMLSFSQVLSLSGKRVSPPPILSCQSTAELQAAISLFIKPNDVVLELGAQLSETSSHLCRAVGADGKAVLVDVQRKEATSGRSPKRNTGKFLGDSMDFPGATMVNVGDKEGESFVDRVEYKELDKFDQWRTLYSIDTNYDVIILDVGSMIGNDLYLTRSQ